MFAIAGSFNHRQRGMPIFALDAHGVARARGPDDRKRPQQRRRRRDPHGSQLTLDGEPRGLPRARGHDGRYRGQRAYDGRARRHPRVLLNEISRKFGDARPSGPRLAHSTRTFGALTTTPPWTSNMRPPGGDGRRGPRGPSGRTRQPSRTCTRPGPSTQPTTMMEPGGDFGGLQPTTGCLRPTRPSGDGRRHY